MVHVKEYSVLKEGDKFYIDCLLRDFHINVKIEFDNKQFKEIKASLQKGEQKNIFGKVYLFNKIGYISFPTTIVFFPKKNLIYTKLLALRLPQDLRETIS
jgi:hypothetical protein